MEAPSNQNHQLSVSCSSTTRTQEQDLKMISDLWGAMMALFGELWTRSFGEMPDKSGQWRQTLLGVSRAQIADAIAEIRLSGRKWPPAAPEFRAICLSTNSEKLPPFEICAVEIQNFVRSGRRDTQNMTPFVYHMVTKNLDFYNYKQFDKEYDRQKSLEIAYKATLFQLESGGKLIAPPPPETLIEQKKPEPINTNSPKFESPISDLLKLFDNPPEPEPTDSDIADLQRLERLKNDV
jgi:hypothetical protein